MSGLERDEALASMQADAEAVTRDRAVRLDRYRRADEEERRQQQREADARDDGAGPRFMRKFANDAIDKAERDLYSRRVA